MRMPSRFHASLFVLIFAVAALASADQGTSGTEPMQRQVTYRIYADPNSADGLIDYEITLSLMERERHAQDIRWTVEAVTIRKPGLDGESDIVWVDALPNVATLGGDWWVTHDDPNDPVNKDFVLPPRISGSAADHAALVPNLNYSLAGTDSPSPESIPWANTTVALDWRFVLASLPPIHDEGEDEPVELPPINLPPAGN